LAAYELDLLHQTSAVTRLQSVRISASAQGAGAAAASPKPAEVTEELSIDGLLTVEQVTRLVSDGYQVIVREPASKRARATQTMDLQDWLKAISEK
jgi:hypothetical protein